MKTVSSAPSGVVVIEVAPDSAAAVIFTVGILPAFPPAVNTGMLQNRQRPAVAVSPPPKFITASSSIGPALPTPTTASEATTSALAIVIDVRRARATICAALCTNENPSLPFIVWSLP